MSSFCLLLSCSSLCLKAKHLEMNCNDVSDVTFDLKLPQTQRKDQPHGFYFEGISFLVSSVLLPRRTASLLLFL